MVRFCSFPFRLVIPSLLLLGVASCLPEGGISRKPTAPVGTEAHFDQQKAACESKGGRFGAGPTGLQVCYRPTKDANQACTRESDCEGICLARSRTCAPVTPLFGCNEVLTDTGQEATLCVD